MKRDRQDAAPQRDPVALVAGRGHLGFDGLLVGGDRVVDERHLGLERVAGVVVVGVVLGLTMVPDTGSTQKVRCAA